MKRFVFVVGLLSLLVVGFGWQSIYAQTPESAVNLYQGHVTDPCPSGTASGLCNTPSSLVNRLGERILTTITFAASVVSIIMIIYSGIMYATALGDEAKSAKAKRSLLYAGIAIVIVVSSVLIEQATINQSTNAPTAAKL